MSRGCRDYVFGMAALVGVCLLVGAAYLNVTLRRHDHVVPAAGAIEVSASVGQPTAAPLPGTLEDPPTPVATANTWPPPDPGGPRPYCWDHPNQGLAPGSACPPKPPGR